MVPHLLFAILAGGTVILPDSIENESSIPFLIFIAVIELLAIVRCRTQAGKDLLSLVWILLIIWEFGTAKLASELNFLAPTPEMVIGVYLYDWRLILKGIWSTTSLLLWGFAVAITVGSLMGMAAGWNEKVRRIFLPIVKVLTPIPPLIYAPYMIVMMPSFRSASAAIIFLTVFWGIFLNTIYAVAGMEQQLKDMVKVLNIGPFTLFTQILFPYCLPEIMSRLTISVSAAFMVLFSAEMLGGTSGVGWYIKFNANFSEYTKVVSGIFVAAVFVVLLNALIKRIQVLAIKWK